MRCLPLRSTLRYVRRSFVSSATVWAKSVTKKRYEELPTRFFLSDGGTAPPLEEVSIQSRRPRARNRDPLRLASLEADEDRLEENAGSVLDASDHDVDEPPEAVVQAFSGDTATTEPPVSKSLKRKRVKEDHEANVSVGVLDPEITEADVEKKKRVRKRTKVAVEELETPSDHVKESAAEPSTDTAIPQTTLSREIHQNMARFPHCLLLTRVGQFYESYFHQAPVLAALLDIKLTSRAWGQKGTRVPMCGFPLTHLDRHLKVLVQQHKRFVAMCEEFPRCAGSEPGFDRRVTRVVTPGTLIDESFLNQYENNYLLAVGRAESLSWSSTSAASPSRHSDEELGLAWIDISTGEFFTQLSSLSTLRNDVARISPKEVVLDERMRDGDSHGVRQLLGEEVGWVSYVAQAPKEDVIDVAAPTDGSRGDHLLPDSDGEEQAVQTDAESTLASRPTIPVLLGPSSTLLVSPIDGIVARTESDDVPASAAPPIPDDIDTSFSTSEAIAINLLTNFLRTNLLELMPRLSAPIREAHEQRMQIDSHTIKALEIREGMAEGGVTGSLLSVVKRTVTSSGTRLLARWLCSPSTSITQINARQSLVALFHARPHLFGDLAELLNRIEDASRIVQKFLLGRGDANDLLAIRDTINVTLQIRSRIAQERHIELQARGGLGAEDWQSVDVLMDRMRDLQPLALRIDQAVDESDLRRRERESLSAPSESFGGAETAEGTSESPLQKPETNMWTIKPSFSPELEGLHDRLNEFRRQKDELEAELKRNFSAPSLQLRTSYSHGLHVRIGNPKRDSSKIGASKKAVLIGQSASSRAFFWPAWSELGANIADTEQAIQVAERRAFESLRREVNAHATSLRRNARIIDEIDVTIGFATAATELRLVRPVMNEGTSYHVVNGRHPTVELGLLDSGRVFTPNSVSLSPTSRLHVITGPNMAGKSTLLRQTALIAILAQTGSFVPADKADIGIVDKVFSRVGAKDDLFRDRSTFMVEMLETAEILRSATDRSLVIMDEVGRGTTVTDGLAIAFATVNHLYSTARCRALFATHFHEIADMLGYSSVPHADDGSSVFPYIGFFCTDVDEIEDGRFAYSHRLRPGVNRDSHGLKVARLAGMPDAAVQVATDALSFIRTRRRAAESSLELRKLGEALATDVGLRQTTVS